MFSIRFDPLMWVLDGRPTLELEYAVVGPLTVELAPMIATGPIWTSKWAQSGGGVEFNLGIFPGGKPFDGFVVRPILQINSLKYTSEYVGPMDADDRTEIKHTEVRVGGLIGSHSKWDFFTIAVGFGLVVDTKDDVDDPTVLRLSEGESLDPTNKIDIIGRLALGVVF